MGERTTVALSKETRDRLKKRGRKGDTYEDIIKRLLGPQRRPSRPSRDYGPDVA